ncbi:MAG: hypothetical protein NTW87_24465 [Planctomycetota bacterium]|nr:hypothetical protein [Planctomycetota bacterium]
MNRGMAIFLAVVVAVVALGFWGLPVLRDKLFGASMKASVKVIMAVDDYEVQTQIKNQTVSRTVLGLEIVFPMGSAPDSIKDLQVVDVEGHPVPVDWTRQETEDNPEQRITRWTIREAFFPLGFRRGVLKSKYRDLGDICVQQVPLNAP